VSSNRAQVHLVGGGADCPNAKELVAPFAGEATRHAARYERRPRLALVMVDDDGSADRYRSAYSDALDAHVLHGFEYTVIRVRTNTSIDPAVFGSVDGIVVAGGPTVRYHACLMPVADAVRAAVDDLVPYLGFSAGAMIAASSALIGGWCDEGRVVCDEDWSEGLDELSFATGLGLVDFTVDVHAVQGGLLGRALAASLRPECQRIAAIDEGTVLSVAAGSATATQSCVSGDGHVWWAEETATGFISTSLLRSY